MLYVHVYVIHVIFLRLTIEDSDKKTCRCLPHCKVSFVVKIFETIQQFRNELIRSDESVESGEKGLSVLLNC